MGSMELGCTRQGFGRDVQPAAPNRPRCWVLVGLMLGVRLVEAGGFCTAFCYGIGFGSGGEPVDGYGARICVSWKLHPLGGGHALLLRRGRGDLARGASETRPGRLRVTMMVSFPGKT